MIQILTFFDIGSPGRKFEYSNFVVNFLQNFFEYTRTKVVNLYTVFLWLILEFWDFCDKNLTILGRDDNYSEKQNRAIDNQTVARMTEKLIATGAFEGNASETNLAEKFIKFLNTSIGRKNIGFRLKLTWHRGNTNSN